MNLNKKSQALPWHILSRSVFLHNFTTPADLKQLVRLGQVSKLFHCSILPALYRSIVCTDERALLHQSTAFVTHAIELIKSGRRSRLAYIQRLSLTEVIETEETRATTSTIAALDDQERHQHITKRAKLYALAKVINECTGLKELLLIFERQHPRQQPHPVAASLNSICATTTSHCDDMMLGPLSALSKAISTRYRLEKLCVENMPPGMSILNSPSVSEFLCRNGAVSWRVLAKMPRLKTLTLSRAAVLNLESLEDELALLPPPPVASALEERSAQQTSVLALAEMRICGIPNLNPELVVGFASLACGPHVRMLEIGSLNSICDRQLLDSILAKLRGLEDLRVYDVPLSVTFLSRLASSKPAKLKSISLTGIGSHVRSIWRASREIQTLEWMHLQGPIVGSYEPGDEADHAELESGYFTTVQCVRKELFLRPDELRELRGIHNFAFEHEYELRSKIEIKSTLAP